MSKTERWEEFLRAECGGSGPHAMLAGNPPLAEVRSLPTGGGSNAILCYSYYRREIRWREERNRSVATPFDLSAWERLPVYAVDEVGATP